MKDVAFLGCHNNGIKALPLDDKNYQAELTHLPLYQMATISQTLFSDAFFVNEKFHILIKISLKFVLKGSIDNNSAVV